LGPANPKSTTTSFVPRQLNKADEQAGNVVFSPRIFGRLNKIVASVLQAGSGIDRRQNLLVA
jgi:hypothetical protein